MRYSLLIAMVFCVVQISAQDVSFILGNGAITDGGNSFEFDVNISSTAGIKLGSGQLYFNYNTPAFGENVVANNRITITHPDGSILATTVGSPPFEFDFYDQFILADNQTDRFSFAWQHAFSSGCLIGDNITGSEQVLFHIKLDFIPSGVGIDPDVCFESSPIFIGQTFTACGPSDCDNVDCNSFPGTQITNENFDCTAPLPIELISFSVEYRQPHSGLLTWHTISEFNSSHFDIERSIGSTSDWQKIGQVDARGISENLANYQFVDEGLGFGTNYYRLKMWDLDGTYEYSVIRSLTIVYPGKLEVFPNPAKDHFYLDLSSLPQGKLIVVIADQSGRVVYNKTIREGEDRFLKIIINDYGFKNGVYGIGVTHREGQSSLKIIVEQGY